MAIVADDREYPLAKVTQELSDFSATCRDALTKRISQIFTDMDLSAADDAGRIVWQFSLTLATFTRNIAEATHQLILHDQLRAAAILDRCLFEYWVRLEYYQGHPQEAIKDHDEMDNQARRFAMLLGPNSRAAIEPEEREAFEKFMEDYAKPKARNFRSMLDAVVKPKEIADELYARHFVLGSVYVHGNEVATQDVFTGEIGVDGRRQIAMNWTTSRLDATGLLAAVTRHVIFTLARLEAGWNLPRTFDRLEAELHRITGVNTIEVRKGSELSGVDRQRILALLEQGDEVNMDSARQELPQCQKVAMVRAGGQVVSVAALKRVRTGYNESVSAKSGRTLPAEIPELGYVVTDSDYQGRHYGRRVCGVVLSGLEGPIFATARVGNESMIRILQRHGFAQVGGVWSSLERPDTNLALWVK